MQRRSKGYSEIIKAPILKCAKVYGEGSNLEGDKVEGQTGAKTYEAL